MYEKANIISTIGIEKEIFDKIHCYQGTPYTKIITNYNNIIDYFKLSVTNYANSPFIIEIVDGIEKEIITYSQIYERIYKLHSFIKKHFNIDVNSRVAILPANSSESFCIILAVLFCGGTAVIINPTEPVDRITNQIESTNCSDVFFDSSYYQLNIKGKIIKELMIKAEVTGEYSNISFSIENEQPAIIMFTTGTTSTSKPIVQMHYNIAVNCHALIKHHNITNNTRLMCTLPIYYANGLEFTLLSVMMVGASVVLCNKFDPLSYFRVLKKYQVHISSLVPSMLNTLLEMPIKPDLSSLRYFVTAAAPLSNITSNLVWEKFNKRIIQGYGLTETTNFSTLLPINLSDKEYSTLMLESAIPSVGSEVLGNEIAILSHDGNIAEDGTEGEICMRGHNIMAGYLNNPNITKESFKYGWFHSGDLGKFITIEKHSTRYLLITGRIKNIIKVNGQALSLDEIDRIISLIEGVKDCVTCSIPDKYAGEIPVSLVVKDDNIVTEQTIISHIARYLNKDKLPRKIRFIDVIPRTMNGKLNRSFIGKNFFSALQD